MEAVTAAPSQATDDWNEAFILHGAHGYIHLQEQKRGNFDKPHSTKYDYCRCSRKIHPWNACHVATKNLLQKESDGHDNGLWDKELKTNDQVQVMMEFLQYNVTDQIQKKITT